MESIQIGPITTVVAVPDTPIRLAAIDEWRSPEPLLEYVQTSPDAFDDCQRWIDRRNSLGDTARRMLGIAERHFFESGQSTMVFSTETDVFIFKRGNPNNTNTKTWEWVLNLVEHGFLEWVKIGYNGIQFKLADDPWLSGGIAHINCREIMRAKFIKPSRWFLGCKSIRDSEG